MIVVEAITSLHVPPPFVPPLPPPQPVGPSGPTDPVSPRIASLIGGQPTFTAIPFVSAQTLQELATELPAACGPINNAGLVLDVRLPVFCRHTNPTASKR